MAPDAADFTFMLRDRTYRVDVGSFAIVAPDFFASYARVQAAREAGDARALAGALAWLSWGFIGLVRYSDPEAPSDELKLAEPHLEALGDELFQQAVEWGYRPGEARKID